MPTDAIRNHAMYTKSDYEYFNAKGCTDAEVLAFWDRDLARGADPVVHKSAPDIVGYINHDEADIRREMADAKQDARMSDFNVIVKDGDEELCRCTVGEFIVDNVDGLGHEEIRDLCALKPGESLVFGGGAAAVFEVAREQEEA